MTLVKALWTWKYFLSRIFFPTSSKLVLWRQKIFLCFEVGCNKYTVQTTKKIWFTLCLMNTCLVFSFSLSYYTSYSLSRTCAFVSVCLCVCLSVCLIVTLWSFASILSVYLGICRVCLLIVYSCMCVLETPMFYIIFILPTFRYGLVACLNSVFLFICLSVFLFKFSLSVFMPFCLSVFL